MQSPMEFIYPFFWLLCGLWVGAFGGWSIKRRAMRNIQGNDQLAEEVAGFSKGYAISFIVPSVTFWLIQLASGSAHPFFVHWNDPYRFVAIGVLVLCWIALLNWVWVRSGADLLSRMMKLAYPKHPAFLLNPIVWKVGAIAGVAGGCWALWDTLGTTGET